MSYVGDNKSHTGAWISKPMQVILSPAYQRLDTWTPVASYVNVISSYADDIYEELHGIFFKCVFDSLYMYLVQCICIWIIKINNILVFVIEKKHERFVF